MKNINEFWRTLQHRWKNRMPVFFRRVSKACLFVSGTALAANTAITQGGGVPHEWWTDIYPYLLGFPAGIAFACKFTQSYDGHGHPIEKSSEKPKAVNDSDIETVSPHEIDPYNEEC